MRKNPFLLLLMLGACFCAQSQTVHQCSGQGGSTAYRSGACLAGERLVDVREMEVEATTPAAPGAGPAVAAGENESSRASRPRHARHARSTRNSRHAGSKRRKATVDPCTREKRARDDFQRKRGIKVTMEQLSRWNHRVYDACK